MAISIWREFHGGMLLQCLPIATIRRRKWFTSTQAHGSVAIHVAMYVFHVSFSSVAPSEVTMISVAWAWFQP
jgi:hypothetical protein